MLPDTRQTTEILIEKEDLHFSAGHFTIFSPTARENLHGHNWYVRARLIGVVGEGGLTFDYNIVKSELRRLCEHLDEKVLMPTQSPYLTLTEEDGYVVVRFADERIPFLPRDIVRVDVRNISVEELSRWMMLRLTSSASIQSLPLRSMCIGVSSGPGQWAEATWQLAGSADGTSL
jgi:6-pyruvoyltetrahydropterin/6-carboxytetrahydropterin synthase